MESEESARNRPPKQKWRLHWFPRAILWLMALSIYTMVVLVLSRRQGDVVYESRQPDDVSYGSSEPYKLKMVEGPVQWSPLDWSSRGASVWIMRSGDDNYGYCVGVSLASADLESCDWRKDGIELVFGSGHRLFVPKSAFIGGR